MLQNGPVGAGGIKYYYQMDPILPGSPCTRFALPATSELWLSVSEISEKERNYLFKSYTDL